jgi:hypothetical protein
MDRNGQTGRWRQSLWNWLALAALLALGIVFPPDAPPAAPRVAAAAHPGAALAARR